mgnify:FL=1
MVKQSCSSFHLSPNTKEGGDIMKNFLPLIEQAKKGDEQAMELLLKDFKPLLIKEASRQGYLDEDCFQNLTETFIKIVRNFDPEKYLG